MRAKRRIVEFWTDPSSGQLSASRLLLMVLILIYLPAMGILELCGHRMGMWGQFAMIVGSVAGAYGLNSGARAWQQGNFQRANPAPKIEGKGD